MHEFLRRCMHVRGAMWVHGYLAHKLLTWMSELRTTAHVGTVAQPLSLPESWKLRRELQGYLAQKKQPPPRTLQSNYLWP